MVFLETGKEVRGRALGGETGMVKLVVEEKKDVRDAGHVSQAV